MYLVPFSAHPGHSRLTQVGYIRRCQAPTLRNRSRGGEATRLKNQGPGFQPGPRCYFSCSAETSGSHASYITPRRALLRTRTFAPPLLTLSTGATIHILSAASLGTTEGGMAPGTVFRPPRLGSIDSGGPYSPVPGTDAANCQRMKVARLEERLFGPGGAVLRLRTLRFHHRCWPRESSPVSWRP